MKLNLPNKITFFRILLIPVFLLTLLGGFIAMPEARYAAASIFVLASFTDMLDGYLARRLNLVTTFGKFLDPIADKLLVCSALVCMVEMGNLASWMAIIMISREFLISGFRIVAAEKGSVIAASLWAKIKTAMQMLMVTLVLLNIQNTVASAVCEFLKWLAVIFSVISAVDYIYKNREVFK